MKEIGVTFTILRTISVPDNYTKDDVETLIDDELADLCLLRKEIDDIEWDELIC